MAVARVAELVAVKVADAVVAAAVVLIVVLVVDLAAATVEAATDGGRTATISRLFRKLGSWSKIRLAQFERFRSCVRPALRFALLSRFRRVYRAFLFANLRLVRRSDSLRSCRTMYKALALRLLLTYSDTRS